MKGKSESEVAQSCPTLPDPMDCSLPVYSIHGIFQARVLEWGAIAFSEGPPIIYHPIQDPATAEMHQESIKKGGTEHAFRHEMAKCIFLAVLQGSNIKAARSTRDMKERVLIPEG